MTDTFLNRATQLAEARDLVYQDFEYASATALLAVHAAIAYNDAVLLKFSGRRGKGESHQRAASETRDLCSARNLNSRGLKHLEKLLARKTDVSYGEEVVSGPAALELANASRRFQEWALGLLGSRRQS